MRYGRGLHRRLARLEVVSNVLSTGDKWKLLHRGALELMSDEDIEILEQMALLREAGNATDELTPAWQAVTKRYDEAIGVALANKRIPFTISEMDQLLATE
jgi:hypothetical protein